MDPKLSLTLLLSLAMAGLSGCAIFTKKSPPPPPDGKLQPGYTSTASGLLYKVIKEGTGRRPRPTDAVQVHYRGLLVSGAEFDSTRSGPATYSLNSHNLVRGWAEGVQLMREGAQYRFMVPPHLGFGAAGGLAGRVPANATLVYEIALLKVQ